MLRGKKDLVLPNRASLVTQWKRIFLPMQETWTQSLGREDSLEKEMVTHSSILVWENPKDRGAWRAIVHGVAKELDMT